MFSIGNLIYRGYIYTEVPTPLWQDRHLISLTGVERHLVMILTSLVPRAHHKVGLMTYTCMSQARANCSKLALHVDTTEVVMRIITASSLTI